MNRYVLAVLAACLVSLPLHAQDRASLSGFVRDVTNGETLILANVFVQELGTGAATNTAGYYTLPNLPAGTYTLTITYIGFREQRMTVTLEANETRRLDIDLVPDSVLIDEVVVTAEEQTREEVKRIGVAQISTEQIKQLPTVLEPDVFRSLQFLPGVKAASDFSSGLYIRGGGPDQTLILLDRTSVYNPTHFFGFFSTFNPDAIKDVRLYKGGYPAAYGGRLGSVVDIYNKDGNRVQRDGSLSLGLLASRALIEGPFSRGSYMLAIRRSTLEPLLAALDGQDGVPNSFYFYDINGKVNFDASANDKLSLSFYAGTDDVNVEPIDDTTFDFTYGNRTVSANWTHLFSERLFSNFTMTASRYFSDPVGSFAETEFERLNRVYDTSIKGDLEFIPNRKHAISGGFWVGNFVMRLQDRFDGQDTLGERIRSLYGSAYIQDQYQPTPQWTVTAGLRSTFFSEGDYFRLEPRLSVEHRPTEAVRIQAGYGRYYQFLTLITSQVFSAFDVWLTTDEGVPPAYGDQFVFGVKTALTPSVNVDVEGYYRTMEELFELDPFLPDAAGLDYNQLFHFGDGFAYGSEVLLEKTDGRLNGFLGYTFGVTKRRFPNLNDGLFYIPKYDRTHDLSLVANYDLASNWRFTAAFQYGTGQAYTEPEGRFRLTDNPFTSVSTDVLVTSFNNRRLPDYHRLDVGFSRLGRFFGFADYELQLQVINVYSRRNVWFFFYEFSDQFAEDPLNAQSTVEVTEVPQIPFPIPNISLTLRF
ncbi:MAG: TonB-dependent receptor [Bacteroidota bacterium]